MMEEQSEDNLPSTSPANSLAIVSGSGKTFSTPATPSSSLSPFVSRIRREICAPEDDLPSNTISQLWKKPIKLPGSGSGSSPNPSHLQASGKRTTPSRKHNRAVPPVKLFNDGDPTLSEPTLPSFGGFNIMRSERDRAAYRRSLSHPESGNCGGGESPTSNPKRMKLFNNADENEISPYEEFNAKKPLSEVVLSSSSSSSSSTLTPAVKKLFVKSQSDPKLHSSNIATALEKIESNPNLIGDASMSYILPIKEKGKHQDLKEITRETMAEVIENKEDFMPGVSFKIIDCRYPYEYEGGHIIGAFNYYTKKQIREELLDTKTALQSPSSAGCGRGRGREVIIFHCEFSSHRGPSLCRFLRDIDRSHNVQAYPFLFYPELYVLYGGYKDFYEKFPLLCEPESYVPMEHPDHQTAYRKYKSRNNLRLGSEKRLGL